MRDSTPRATGSAVYQEVIPDEFRHQAYVIEAVLQFHCCRQQAHDLVIYDRWFPAFGVFLDYVVQYRDCVDSLLALLPVPDIVFVLEVSPQVAARRLIQRGDWMTDRYDPASLERLLASHAQVYAGQDGSNVVRLDGTQSVAAIVNEVLQHIAAIGVRP